ncbi:MAG: ATP-dependent RecD-like DNA helicase [Oscillospiraceae bacterium]|nr:ATP-dependent RecD-like DNA helicase [Oscillospiraceae bacterium]
MAGAPYESYTGEIAEIIYQNEDNGYTIAEFETDEITFTAVGYMPSVSTGEQLKISGKWINHQTYGEQFKIEAYEKTAPKGEGAILRYLSSGIIAGVREATAKKIVERFGENSLDIIENHPLKLAEIKGISAQKAVLISQSYIEKMGASTLVMFLQQYSVSINLAAKIYKKIGTGAVEFIKKNPYILCDEIDGIGFKTADSIALSMGFSKDNASRIKSGTLYALKTNTLFGHTYLPRSVLVSEASRLLGADSAEVEFAVESLIFQNSVISEKVENEERIYYFSHYYAEKYTAEKIKELSSVSFDEDENRILNEIEQIEKYQKISLAENQKSAVINALKCGVSIITGGPGTGKTTIINTVIELLKMRGLKVVLTAPTGRAAKRMSQICNMDAKTIHRLLGAGYADGDDNLTFSIDEENPLVQDVIIVDEMSMVDILLMQSLLRAVKKGKRLIMAGDINQLPSVGPGNVLKDIIKSKIVKTTYLTEIFRQAKKSMIVVNAHKIINGNMPISNGKNTDFFFAQIPDAAKGAEYIVSLVTDKLPRKYDVLPFDIQVLSPYKKGIAGIINLNSVLQNKINPFDIRKNQKDFGDITFREGDKVMQNRNNYDIKWTDTETGEEGSGVFNGDVGYIQFINHSFKTVTVIMDEKCVVYDFKNLDELDLAYAITVHKSQGSEFKIVIIPMYDGPYMLINRNLLYTAVTRARSVAVLVGSESVMRKMIDNNKETRRYSGLCEKIIGESKNENSK